LASLFASEAVNLLSQNIGNRVVGLQRGQITSIDLETSCRNEKPLNVELLNLARDLAT
jgi:6-phosphofructokinase